MRAFTLIEIVVVVAVYVIVMSSFIAYNSASRAQIALSVEQAKISQLILRAKSLTIASYSSPSSLRCGFGFSINYPARSYSLNRYDVLDNADCDAIYYGEAGFENTIVVPLPLETYYLDPNLGFPGWGASDQFDEVLFIAPEPKTFLKVGGSLFRGTANIYLETRAAPIRSVTVSINSLGQVSF